MTNDGLMTDIKFGTDGWRGIIADDFTFENVRRVAGAIASYVLKHEDPTRGIIIGYDTRFASDRAARAVAEVIAGAGIPVRLSNDYLPTPTVSFNVKKLGAAGGVMVTSSHNPWNWNGVKFKAKFGGSATPAIMKMIEGELAAGAMPRHSAPAKIEEVDLKAAYIEGVCAFADLELDSQSEFQVCDRLDVWLRPRRAAGDFRQERNPIHRHPAGSQPAVSRESIPSRFCRMLHCCRKPS